MSYDAVILSRHPRAYWRMDDTSGNIAHDITGNGYHATVTGATLSQPGALIGDSNTSMLFTAGGGLTIPYTLQPFTWSAASLEFWINFGSAWHHIVETVDNVHGTTLYLDGAVTTSGNGASVLLGQNFDFAGSFTASAYLDEIAIYNYVLSAQDVAADYLNNEPTLNITLTARDGIITLASR